VLTTTSRVVVPRKELSDIEDEDNDDDEVE